SSCCFHLRRPAYDAAGLLLHPVGQRRSVGWLMEEFDYSERAACKLECPNDLRTTSEGWVSTSPLSHFPGRVIAENCALTVRLSFGDKSKAKLTMRKSYGFRTFRILELALYHSLGKLPEPELTHEFF